MSGSPVPVEAVLRFLDSCTIGYDYNGVAGDFTAASSLHRQVPRTISWTRDPKTDASRLGCSVIVAPRGISMVGGCAAVIAVDEPRRVFAAILRRFLAPPRPVYIAETARISSSATIGRDAQIGDYVTIGSGCNIGERVTIGAGVRIHDTTTIGNDVVIGAGSVVGGCGFGFVWEQGRGYVRFPHLGSVVIEDDVEIGNNVCIDRGTLDHTHIGRGTKIDNLCHIGHNVTLGKHVVLTAGVEVSGSVRIGDRTYVAPSSSFNDGLEIGSDCFVGIGAVVTKSFGANKRLIGVPARSIGKTV